MKKLWVWGIFLGLILAFVHVSFKVREWSPWKTGTDYSKKSPKQIFQIMLDKPIPKGVSNLKTVGRNFSFKRWAWMSFNADGQALKSILQGTTKIDLSQIPFTRPSAATDCDAIDKAKVGWAEIQKVEQPEYFTWNTMSASKPAGWWSGYFVVDKKRHRIFAVGQME